MKFTPVSNERVICFDPPKQAFLSLFTYFSPSDKRSASQKRTLAFYSSMKNAPFGLNSKEIAYFKKSV